MYICIYIYMYVYIHSTYIYIGYAPCLARSGPGLTLTLNPFSEAKTAP